MAAINDVDVEYQYKLKRPPILLATYLSVLLLSIYCYTDPNANWSKNNWLPSSLLIILTYLCFVEIFLLVKRNLSTSLVPVVLWVSFLITYPISGLAHIANDTTLISGYVDIIRDPVRSAHGRIYFAISLVCAAQAAFHYGYSSISSRVVINENMAPPRPPQLSPQAMYVGVILIFLGIFSFLKLFGSAQSTISSLSMINRDMDLESGTARYVFMSQWGIWGALIILAYSIKRSNSSIRSMLATLIFCVFTISSIYWTGSRSSAVFFIMPAFLLVARTQPRHTVPVAIGLIALILVFFEVVTIQRMTTDASLEGGDVGGWNVLLSVLDWQIGRFSMAGYSRDLVATYGWGWGNSLLSDVVQIINAPGKLLGFDDFFVQSQSLTSLIGLDLRGSAEINGIVPGGICAMYYNFGWIGVVVGFYLIGRVASITAVKIWTTQTFAGFGIAVFFVTLLPMAVFSGTVSEIFYRLPVFGAPLFVLLFIEKMTGTRGHLEK